MCHKYMYIISFIQKFLQYYTKQVHFYETVNECSEPLSVKVNSNVTSAFAHNRLLPQTPLLTYEANTKAGVTWEQGLAEKKTINPLSFLGWNIGDLNWIKGNCHCNCLCIINRHTFVINLCTNANMHVCLSYPRTVNPILILYVRIDTRIDPCNGMTEINGLWMILASIPSCMNMHLLIKMAFWSWWWIDVECTQGDTVDYLFQPYLATIRSNACFASTSSYARSGFESSRVFGSDMISLRICTIILYRYTNILTWVMVTILQSRSIFVFAARTRSCRKVMFSLPSICPRGEGGRYHQMHHGTGHMVGSPLDIRPGIYPLPQSDICWWPLKYARFASEEGGGLRILL